MKVVRNNIIPFKGFEAVNLFGVLFVRKDRVFESKHAWQVMIRHETIHTKQMQELGYLPFYMLYALEWLVRWIACGDATRAYFNISFEREAYAYQDTIGYTDWRRHYEFLRYIFKRR